MNAFFRIQIALLSLALSHSLWAQSNEKTEPGGGIGGTGYSSESLMENMSANAPAECSKTMSIGLIESLSGSSFRLKKGDLLCTGNRIESTDTARLTIRLHDGTRIILANSTIISVTEMTRTGNGKAYLQLKLESGKIRLQSEPGKEESLQVLLPTQKNIIVLIGADTEVQMKSTRDSELNGKSEFYIRAHKGVTRLITEDRTIEILQGSTAELLFQNNNFEIKQLK